MTEQDLPERESMEFDVVIVGAGPAGLAAAIRLKQVNPELSVVVLEKGAEVGAHILSGAVVDPIGIDRLLPDWRADAEFLRLCRQPATDVAERYDVVAVIVHQRRHQEVRQADRAGGP